MLLANLPRWRNGLRTALKMLRPKGLWVRIPPAALNLTQCLMHDDLAKKTAVEYTTLMKVEIESGAINKPSVQTMAKIAKALDVSIENLIK